MSESPENAGRVEELFKAALELAPEQRSAYLRKTEMEAAVCEEVERLLFEHDQTTSFLSGPALQEVEFQPKRSTHRFSSGEILAGRFQVARFIAAGGMGEVYEARDLELQESLAIKTIKLETLQSSNALDRFKREVHLARKVTHPNVCRVFDLFRHKSETNEEVVFVSMELLQGQSLSDRIRRAGPLSLQEVLPLIEQICSGLAAAHRVGIVHRDFKPGNVMLVPTGESARIRAAITDFGLAFRFGAEANLTTDFATTRGVLGTPAYMAPEQIEGGEVTSTADIYALGLAIHEMVTGVLPFASEPPLSMMLKRLHAPVPSPRLLMPSLDAAWESAILRCLEREPSDRFQTVEELVRALVEGQAPPYDRVSPLSPELRQQRGDSVEARTGAASRSKAMPASARLRSLQNSEIAMGSDAAGLRTGVTLPLPPAPRKAPLWIVWGLALAVLIAAGIAYRLYTAKKPSPAASTPLPMVTARPSAAVLHFENVGAQQQAWLGTALSEMLTTELSAGGQIRTITGEDVARTETDLSLARMPSYSADTLQKIRGNLGCDYVVGGSFLASGNRPVDSVRVDIRLQDARSGQTILSSADSGSIAEMPDLMERIGRNLRDKLGIQAPSEVESIAAKASIPTNPEALRLYADGLTKLRTMDAQGARDDLQKAVSLEPLFALAHDALAEAWQFLGYDANAQQQAKLALDLSGGLSQVDRRSIEGRYRKMTAEWDKAIEIYRSLWGVYDDNPDYALELASVQTSAGKGRDALATLLQLQTRPDLKDDPRVDLGEAFAAESVSNIKLQQSSAAKAGQEATHRGARLLAAQAYWQDCAALFALGDPKSAEAACRQGSQIADYDGGQQMKARNLTVLSRILQTEGQEAQALELREQALQIVRQIGSRKDIIGALMNLADIQSAQGKTAEAQKNEQEAIGIAREIGDKQQLLNLENNFAADLTTQGDYEQARAFYEDSLQTARDLGDQSGIATGLQNLSVVALETGDLAGAEKNVRQGLSISQAAHLESLTASGFSNLGDIQMAKGNFADALTNYQQAQKLFQQIGDPANTGGVNLSLAKLSLEQGNAGNSITLANQAIPEFQSEKLADSEADARNTLARALLMQGKLPDATQQSDAASKLAPQDQAIKISVAVTAARLKARGGKTAEAKQDLDTELADARRMKLLQSEFEIRLAEAEIGASADPKLAASSLSSLVHDARTAGYLLVASKAEHFHSSSEAPPPANTNEPSQTALHN
jgi:serine/threonine protein kinase/tetratricopeptide (TPR) repeat protein